MEKTNRKNFLNVATVFLLLVSSAATAKTVVITCSCDVNDQIDVQAPIKNEANNKSITWIKGDTVIVQNGKFWRAYEYNGYGLFLITLSGGEGDYKDSTVNSVTFTWDDGRACERKATAFLQLSCAIESGFSCSCGNPNGDYNCVKPGREDRDLP